MTLKPERHVWVQLRELERAKALLILPCNAAACVGKHPGALRDQERTDAEGRDTPWGSRLGRACRPSLESGGDCR